MILDDLVDGGVASALGRCRLMDERPRVLLGSGVSLGHLVSIESWPGSCRCSGRTAGAIAASRRGVWTGVKVGCPSGADVWVPRPRVCSLRSSVRTDGLANGNEAGGIAQMLVTPFRVPGVLWHWAGRDD